MPKNIPGLSMRLFTHSMLAKQQYKILLRQIQSALSVYNLCGVLILDTLTNFSFLRLTKFANIIKIINLPICIGIFKIRKKLSYSKEYEK